MVNTNLTNLLKIGVSTQTVTTDAYGQFALAPPTGTTIIAMHSGHGSYGVWQYTYSKGRAYVMVGSTPSWAKNVSLEIIYVYAYTGFMA